MNLLYNINNWGLGIGDWGLGIAQSPIPNPHPQYYLSNKNNIIKTFKQFQINFLIII